MNSRQEQEIDMAILWLNLGEYMTMPGWLPARTPHIQTNIKENGVLRLSFSGKTTATPTYLGGITKDNIDLLIPKFESEVGVVVSKENLLNARVSQFDVKRDIHFDRYIFDAISQLRELATTNTMNNEIHTFDSKIGFKSSMLIRSIAKSYMDSLTVYNKFYEMWINRCNDGGYFNSFTEEFLESCKDILRFERRIKGAKKLRQVLRLNRDEKINLQKIFDCPYPILTEKIEQHFGKIYEQEEN